MSGVGKKEKKGNKKRSAATKRRVVADIKKTNAERMGEKVRKTWLSASSKSQEGREKTKERKKERRKGEKSKHKRFFG